MSVVIDGAGKQRIHLREAYCLGQNLCSEQETDESFTRDITVIRGALAMRA
jgi:hypothetical protein